MLVPRNVLFVVLVLMSLVGVPAYAQSAERIVVDFNIQHDTTVQERITFFFAAPVNGVVNYTLANAVQNVIASDGTGQVPAFVEQTDSGYVVHVQFNRPTTQLELQYQVEGIIFQSESVYHFFTEFSFDQPVPVMSVQVRLPAGFVIYREGISPPNALTTSDGERIIVQWNMSEPADTFFSVKYISLSQDSGIALALIMGLLGVGVIGYLVMRQRAREAFEVGFRVDEQKTIEYLRLQKVALQSDLQKQFGFSRAKATRIVSVLESKNLVRKQRYGRTNKLFWLK